MRNLTALLSAPPFTYSCWFYPTTNAQFHNLMAFGVDGSNNNRFTMNATDSASGQHLRAQTRDSSNALADTTTTYNVNAWNHAMAVFTSASSRHSILNGGGKTTEASTISPTGMNAFYVANNMGLGAQLGGRIAECAIWTVALTDAENLILANGFSPLLVRPQSLFDYWPVLGNGSTEIGVKGTVLTPSGTVKAEHCRVFMPSRRYKAAHAAAGPVVPVFMNQYRQRAA